MSGRDHSIASISSCPLKQLASSIEYEWSSSEHLSRHVGWVTFCGGSEKSRFSFPCHWWQYRSSIWIYTPLVEIPARYGRRQSTIRIYMSLMATRMVEFQDKSSAEILFSAVLASWWLQDSKFSVDVCVLLELKMECLLLLNEPLFILNGSICTRAAIGALHPCKCVMHGNITYYYTSMCFMC
ncbi:unnamed protein product [Macrosiphum euphorbiae]|uniref:Uncharacterized protein n=1 Tax=Macrosiphum euphorbiae TaxID=13131 RepID=A0AAV0XY36_9HEMI|nr:unnamed protein product [Macrosiphum euphorbiae]